VPENAGAAASTSGSRSAAPGPIGPPAQRRGEVAAGEPRRIAPLEVVEHLGQRRADDALHREVRHAALLADGVHGDEPRVRELRDRVDLAPKARARAGQVEQLRPDDLERDLAPHAELRRAVDEPHAAAAERLVQLEVPEPARRGARLRPRRDEPGPHQRVQAPAKLGRAPGVAGAKRVDRGRTGLLDVGQAFDDQILEPVGLRPALLPRRAGVKVGLPLHDRVRGIRSYAEAGRPAPPLQRVSS
jgi:hypothetical protein